MFNIGPQELLIVLVLALIVVGPQKLPELSRQIGRGLREFRKVQDEVKGMVKFDLDDTPERSTTTRSASPSSAPTDAPRVHRTTRPAPAGDPAVRAPGPIEGEPPAATPSG
jgi:Tat protein translocase TatB subunit